MLGLSTMSDIFRSFHWLWSMLGVGVLLLLGAEPADARTLHVRLDTSAWIHRQAFLKVWATTNRDGPRDETPIRFTGIRHDGSVGPLSTWGTGGMEGDLILLSRSPAIWSLPTWGDHAFAINFAEKEFMPDEAWIGSFVRFDVDLPTRRRAGARATSERMIVALLDPTMEPFFPGADDLLVCERGGGSEDWAVRSPKRVTKGRGSAPDTIRLVLPPPGITAAPPIRPRRVLPRIRSVDRMLQGELWIEYIVPAPGGPVSVTVLDAKGVERYTFKSVHTDPCVCGVQWPDDPRKEPIPPAGRYHIVVEIAGHRLERDIVLEEFRRP